MAFQHQADFLNFLKTWDDVANVSEYGPRQNFILDECTATSRQDDYLNSINKRRGTSPLSTPLWRDSHVVYGESRVTGRDEADERSVTFSADNAPNLAPSLELEPNLQAVRLESVSGLWKLYPHSYTSPKDLYHDLKRWIDASQAGRADPADFALLEEWLETLNEKRDNRPVWATTRPSVSVILDKKRKWAGRLRDALGLAHMNGDPRNPCFVVLLEYSLQRVFDEHRYAPGWAATPTVLDDVPSSGINYAFFPAARSATAKGMGFAVDLDPNDSDAPPEFLHAPVKWELNDFKRVAEISTATTKSAVDAARTRHLARFSGQYKHAGDLP